MNISNSIPDRLMTDLKRYKQILFNLMGNAIKFTYQGSITVTVGFRDNELISEVADTGIGI